MKRKQFSWAAVMTAFLVLLLAGCGGGSDETYEAPEATPAAGASAGGQGELPEGHPPMGNPGTPAVPPPPPGAGVGSTALQWDVPETWVEETPSSSMRKAQYHVPGSGGDAELVVFYFGPGQGGDPMANAERWAGMFTQPDGSSSVESMKTSNMEINQVPMLLIETTGTYSNRMVSEDSFPDYMLLGAVAKGPDANWFFKMTGPETTIEENRDGFVGMLSSIKPGE